MDTTRDPETIPDGKEAVATATAAKRLGLPVAALEQALERGYVDGVRRPDGGWLVLLDRPATYAPAGEPPDLAFAPPPATDVADAADAAAEPEPIVPEAAPTDIEAPPEMAATEAEPVPESSPERPSESPQESPQVGPTSRSKSSDILDYLRDEVRFLRQELARRDAMLAAKDGAIAKLIERFAEVNVEIVQRVPSADTIQSQISQTHLSHRQVAERHERELTSIKDVLNSVRGYLAHPSAEDEG